MNISPYLRRAGHFFVAAFFMWAAADVLAVTLGPNTRSAVLGQPLDLAMQMTLDAGDDPQGLCLDADVFYADRQIDRAGLVLTPEKAANAQDWLVHIRAAAPVEGPVVTVHLRAGCLRKTLRRYVVLAVARPLSAAPAPDNVGTNDKVQALETELRQLRADLLRNQAALAESRMRQDKAESGRYDKVLVYGLAALLSLAVLGLFSLFYLRTLDRSGPPVSSPATTGPGSVTGASTVLPLFGASRTDPDHSESMFDAFKRASRSPASESLASLPQRDRPRFSVSVPFVQRTVKVPELFDLQQQVEFFSSLGKQDKAIDLLRKHLVANVRTSPLVYLDLLDLYHRTGNRQDYEDLRDDFNRVFHTAIAPFDSYAPSAAGGTAFAAVLLGIQAVWPNRQVFKLIEDAVFGEPGNPDEVLALEAYQDLLLLHAVAREIIDQASGANGGSEQTHWPDLAMQPRSSPRLGLDIDLSQLSGAPHGGSSSPEAGPASHGSGAPVAPGLAELLELARKKEKMRAGPNSQGTSGHPPSDFHRSTGLDSLVDFDDYDTGYRPSGFGNSGRSR